MKKTKILKKEKTAGLFSSKSTVFSMKSYFYSDVFCSSAVQSLKIPPSNA